MNPRPEDSQLYITILQFIDRFITANIHKKYLSRHLSLESRSCRSVHSSHLCLPARGKGDHLKPFRGIKFTKKKCFTAVNDFRRQILYYEITFFYSSLLFLFQSLLKIKQLTFMCFYYNINRYIYYRRRINQKKQFLLQIWQEITR